jgi:hypothetical protein
MELFKELSGEANWLFVHRHKSGETGAIPGYLLMAMVA